MTRKIRLVAVAVTAAIALSLGAGLAWSQVHQPASKPGYSLPEERGLSDFQR